MKYELQSMPQSGDTVLVGMSGGVDSTLVALLLKQKGCKITSVQVTMLLLYALKAAFSKRMSALI